MQAIRCRVLRRTAGATDCESDLRLTHDGKDCRRHGGGFSGGATIRVVTCTVLSFFLRRPGAVTAQTCGPMSWRRSAATDPSTGSAVKQSCGREEASSRYVVGCSAGTDSAGESGATAGGAGGSSGCRQRFSPRCTMGFAGGGAWLMCAVLWLRWYVTALPGKWVHRRSA